jgi:hypothetical protein
MEQISAELHVDLPICLNDGRCAQDPNGYYCQCPEGYVGTHCETEMNPCIPNPCLNDGACKHNSKGYKCVCFKGEKIYEHQIYYEEYSGVNCSIFHGWEKEGMKGMPTARFELAAAFDVTNGVLFAVGGFDGSILNTVEAYDVQTDTWATKQPIYLNSLNSRGVFHTCHEILRQIIL